MTAGVGCRPPWMNKILWFARGLIGFVFFFNIQCSVLFLSYPQAYTAGFEVNGASGDAVIRGFGLLFLMWNIPYAVALVHPYRHVVSLIEACIMQAIGLFGETILLLALPGGHPAIQATVDRFILFDGGGLVLLLIAFGVIARLKYHHPSQLIINSSLDQ